MTDGTEQHNPLTAGTLNTNAKTITIGIVNISGTTARTLTFTNSTLNITGTGTSWNAGTITSLTRTLTGSTINMLASGVTFAGGSIATYNAVVFTGGGTKAITGANTFVILTITGTTALSDAMTINTSGQTITGILTVAGNSQAARVRFGSNIPGTAKTITAAAVSLSNVDVVSVTAAGTASPFTGTSIGNLGGNTNVTATGAKTVYWVGNGGNWSDAANHWAATSGGAPG